jgi:ABC-2 type transport system ATP-binding protein
MLTLNEVTKVFKSDLLAAPFVALEKVSFTIPEGSMVGFLGANGAGKTTSLKIALGFISSTSGSANFSDKLGMSRSEALKKVGFLPERPYYYQHLVGRDFIHFMGKLSGLSVKTINQKISVLAERFRVDHALDRELKTYSKGMLQRIGFLVTVLHDPELILLDEPLSGLDPVGRKELKDIIVDIHKEGRTVFFSTHIVSDVEEICDRVIFLNKGKLAYDGPVAPLMNEHIKPIWRLVIPKGALSGSAGIIKRVELSGGVDSIEVLATDKDRLVKELIDSGHGLMSLEQEKTRLEEIFYKTGMQK